MTVSAMNHSQTDSLLCCFSNDTKPVDMLSALNPRKFLGQLRRVAKNDKKDKRVKDVEQGSNVDDKDVKEGISPAQISPQKQQRRQTVVLNQVLTECSIDAHPDTLLRKIGLIRQKRTIRRGMKSVLIRFDAATNMWFDEETNLPFDDDPGADSRWSEVDTVPNGVIIVAGELDVETTNPYDCRVEDLQQLESLLKLKLANTEGDLLEKCRRRVQTFGSLDLS
jgi:hypothetical protein